MTTRPTLLDGGLGQELLRRRPGPAPELWSTQVLLDDPDLVREVHDDFLAAGADVVTTGTYAVLPDRLAPYGLEDRLEELVRRGCQLAVDARDGAGRGQVAGALGPLGASYRPDLAPPVEDAAEVYATMAALQAPYVDLHLLETMPSLGLARGAARGAASTGLPVWLGVTVDDADGTRLRSGEPVADALDVAREEGAAVLLVNCSTPEAVTAALPVLLGRGLPVGAYANGFERIAPAFLEPGATVDVLAARDDLTPEAYAVAVAGWVAAGAEVVGGCCEVGPAHVAALAAALSTREPAG